MLKKLNHIAIVVPSLEKANDIYINKFKANVSKPKIYPKHGVRVSFVQLTNTMIELMEPHGKKSPINNFLVKNPEGGIHHICIEVSDINKACNHLKEKDVRILGDGTPKIGAHNIWCRNPSCQMATSCTRCIENYPRNTDTIL